MNNSIVKMTFDTKVAADLGNTDAAIVFSNFEHWVYLNHFNDRNMNDGKAWTYNSITAYMEVFVWLSRKRIRTCIDKLESAGYIVSGEYNSDRSDRTKWYSIADEHYHLPKRASRLAQSGKPFAQTGNSRLAQMGNSYKEHIINTDNKPYIPQTEISKVSTDSINNLEVVTPQTAAPQFASDWMQANAPSLWESAWMKAPAVARSSRDKVIDHFNSKVLTEQLKYDGAVLYGRLIGVMNNWKAGSESVQVSKRKLLA